MEREGIRKGNKSRGGYRRKWRKGRKDQGVRWKNERKKRKRNSLERRLMEEWKEEER